MTHRPSTDGAPFDFEPGEALARRLDTEDPLAALRSRFLFPTRADGSPVVYFTGHSLGLQPSGVRQALEQELDA